MSFQKRFRANFLDDAKLKRDERTVMVVEDDEAYRYALGRKLAAAGYQVVEMESGLDALTWFDDGGQIDALITDLRLPPGTPNGLSLALMVRRRQPRATIFLHSAYSGLAENVEGDLGRLMPKSAGIEPVIDALQAAFAA
jgi:CheY-like chemotaxis protein